jgi:UV DNA damage endonuclease
MQLSWAQRNQDDKRDEKWHKIVKHNLELLSDIITWNKHSQVYLYRISSDLFPLADHATGRIMWTTYLDELDKYPEILAAKNNIALSLQSGCRYTIHPGQFVSIGSCMDMTRYSSVRNLEYHGQLLDLLGLPQDYSCPINIHVSRGKLAQDPQSRLNIVRNVRNCLETLPKSVTSRLVFENEQSGYWTVDHLREFFPEVPVTFDYHHYNLNPGALSKEDAVAVAAESWPNGDPVQHYSEPRKHAKDPAHSDYVAALPDTPYDLEIEAKMKNLSLTSPGRVLHGFMGRLNAFRTHYTE